MFGQGFTCPALLASLRTPFPYGTVTPYGGPFQKPSGRRSQSTGLVPGRSSLLGESRLLSFPPATEIFQFAGFASCAYGFGARYHAIVVGFPIRTSGAQRPLTPRPGLSQCATSFIASRRQGIHQMPFVHSPAPARNPPRHGFEEPCRTAPRLKPRAYLQTPSTNADPCAVRTTRRTRTTPASCREPSSRCPTSRPPRPRPAAATETLVLPHRRPSAPQAGRRSLLARDPSRAAFDLSNGGPRTGPRGRMPAASVGGGGGPGPI